MQTNSLNKNGKERGVSIVFFLIALVLVWSIAAMAMYVMSNTTLQHRRNDFTAAVEVADGAAVLAAQDLQVAYTNVSGAGTFFTRLQTNATGAYFLVGTNTNNVVLYQRTISSPFNNQTAVAQIWLTNMPNPSTAQIIAWAAVGNTAATNILNVQMTFGYGAAVVSVNAGDADTSVSKTSAKNDGNVVVSGGGKGPLVIYGGTGLAIWANGQANVSSAATGASVSGVSATNFGAANQIPDFTDQGNANALFDIGRLLAVADLTPNGYSTLGNNHFTNVQTFINACNVHTNSATAMEGVVAVDINWNDGQKGNITLANIPLGINVRGVLLFNMLGTGWTINTGIAVDAPVNVNPADLTHMVPTDPSTYTTGYPPVYSDSRKNPINIDITSKGYQNFIAADDLPAYLYNVGMVDMHGNMNVSGALYTPSYVEIENAGATTVGKYIRGAIIMGGGVYIENNSTVYTVISYDKNAVGSLATSNNVGKKVLASYWQ